MSNVSETENTAELMPLSPDLSKPSEEPSTSSTSEPGTQLHAEKGDSNSVRDACSKDGDLICCNRCSASFHSVCCDPPLDRGDIPARLWLCNKCQGFDMKEALTSKSSDAQSSTDMSDSDQKTKGSNEGIIKEEMIDEKEESKMEVENELSPMEVVEEVAIKDEECEKTDEEEECKQELEKESYPMEVGEESPANMDAAKEEIIDEEGEIEKELEEELTPLDVLVKAANIVNPRQFDPPGQVTLPDVLPETDDELESPPTGVAGCLAARECDACGGNCHQAPLLQCDYCPLLFHQDCLNPPLDDLPTGRWMCPNHINKYIDWNVVNAMSSAERVALWDRFPVAGDIHDLVDFVRRARCPSPFQLNVPGGEKGRVVVPHGVRAHYRRPPPLLPSRREYVDCTSLRERLRAQESRASVGKIGVKRPRGRSAADTGGSGSGGVKMPAEGTQGLRLHTQQSGLKTENLESAHHSRVKTQTVGDKTQSGSKTQQQRAKTQKLVGAKELGLRVQQPVVMKQDPRIQSLKTIPPELETKTQVTDRKQEPVGKKAQSLATKPQGSVETQDSGTGPQKIVARTEVLGAGQQETTVRSVERGVKRKEPERAQEPQEPGARPQEPLARPQTSGVKTHDQLAKVPALRTGGSEVKPQGGTSQSLISTTSESRVRAQQLPAGAQGPRTRLLIVGAKHQGLTTRPRLMGSIQEPGVRPQRPGARPQRPGAGPQGLRPRSQGPGLRAKGPIRKILRPRPRTLVQGIRSLLTAKTQEPMATLQRPMVGPQPMRPTMQAPMTRPQGSMVRPKSPVASPQLMTAKMQEPMARPQGSMVRPQGSMVRPQGPVVRPQLMRAKTQEPMARPQECTVRPQGSMVRPQGPVVRPQLMTTKTQELMTRPQGLGVRPQLMRPKTEEPMAKPQGLPIRPQLMRAMMQGPMARPKRPVERPQLQGARTLASPQGPVVRPQLLRSKTQEPMGPPKAPMVRPQALRSTTQEPMARPRGPMVRPQLMRASPQGPRSNPPGMGLRPQDSGTTPQNPVAIPVGQESEELETAARTQGLGAKMHESRARTRELVTRPQGPAASNQEKAVWLQGLGTRTEPGVSPQESEVKPQGSGKIETAVRTQGLIGTTRESGTRPQGLGPSPQRLIARPQQPGARLLRPGIKTQSPGIRPQQPGVRPQGPGIRPQGPGLRPQKSIAGPQAPRPRESGPRIVSPGIRPQGPGTKIPDPKAKGQEVGVRQQQPVVKKEGPGIRRVVRPQEPGPVPQLPGGTQQATQPQLSGVINKEEEAQNTKIQDAGVKMIGLPAKPIGQSAKPLGELEKPLALRAKRYKLQAKRLKPGSIPPGVVKELLKRSQQSGVNKEELIDETSLFPKTQDHKKRVTKRSREVEELMETVNYQLKNLDEETIAMLALEMIQQIAVAEASSGAWRRSPAGTWSARARGALGGTARAALRRRGVRLVALPSALLPHAERRRIARRVWGETPQCSVADRLADSLVRAALCPLYPLPGGSDAEATLGAPVAMRAATLTVGTLLASDLPLPPLCRRASERHALIFCDQVTGHYELINYSEYGTCVNGVLYACDSEPREPQPPEPQPQQPEPQPLQSEPEPQPQPQIARLTQVERPSAEQCRCGPLEQRAAGAWEGGALLPHGSLLQFGCLRYVFSILDQWQEREGPGDEQDDVKEDVSVP